MLSKALFSLRSVAPVAARSFAASSAGSNSTSSSDAKRVVVTGAAG